MRSSKPEADHLLERRDALGHEREAALAQPRHPAGHRQLFQLGRGHALPDPGPHLRRAGQEFEDRAPAAVAGAVAARAARAFEELHRPGPREPPRGERLRGRGIGRLAKTYFNSKDQLVTLGFAGGPGPAFAGAPYTGWQLGREFGALINNHNVGGFQTIINAAADPRNGTDWSDVTQVHCVRWQDNASAQISIDALTSQSRAWEIFAANGGHSSIAVIIEMQMRHGMPPIQMALDHGILPSLSPDVETNMTTDPFSMMRGAFCVQRALANDLVFPISNPNNLPAPQLITCRQVIEMMTIAGAAANRVLDKVGTLTPGKEADIVVLDASNINVAPINNVAGAIVTMMDTRNVRDVLIAGKIVYRSGKLVGWDTRRLVRDITRARDRVLRRINGPALVGTLPPGQNSLSNPYRPNFLGSCCYKGQNTTAPEYRLRP